jgi:choline dehydrogenase
MPRLATLAFFVGLATTVFAQGVTTNRWPPSWPPSYSNNTFEYIVVGSGAGGGPLASRLARAGHSVLLIEAGNDQGTDTNYTVPAFQAAVAADPKLRWDFYVNHYPTLDRAQRDPHYVYQLSNGTQYVGLTPPSGAKPLGIL